MYNRSYSESFGNNSSDDDDDDENKWQKQKYRKVWKDITQNNGKEMADSSKSMINLWEGWATYLQKKYYQKLIVLKMQIIWGIRKGNWNDRM